MNSSPSPYLKVTRLQSTQRGIEQHLFVLDVHALDGTDALREHEGLRLGERRRGEPPAVPLPDHRRVEALLDGRPDREGRCEGVASHLEVGAVAHAALVDRAEQLVGRVPGEHVRQPRLDPYAHQGQPPRFLPGRRLGELLVAQLHAGFFVGALGMGVRQRHRHVEVGGAGVERAAEDRHHEARVGGVQHMRGADGCGRTRPPRRDRRRRW